MCIDMKKLGNIFVLLFWIFAWIVFGIVEFKKGIDTFGSYCQVYIVNDLQKCKMNLSKFMQ